jgi:hypothetical protein
MKKLLFYAIIALLVSCGGNQQKPVESQIEITKHGENITSDDALNPQEFLAKFEGKDSLYTKLTATVDDVCAKKGCWMTLVLDDETTMMVSFKDYEFFVPKDAYGKIATIEGVATIDTISVKEQRHYLEDSDASQEEIDAITEPEISYAFEATGVIIKGEASKDEE